MNKSIPRSIIDMLPENIYWVDVDGRVVGCNQNQAEVFGFKIPEELMGKNIFDIAQQLGWSDSIPKSIRENDLEIMQTRKSKVFEEDLFWYGKHCHVLSFKHPWINDNDEVVGIVGISLDITERKNFEIELLKAKENAEIANKAKSEFLANLSHDLRTPLSSLVVLNSYIAKNSKEETINSFAVDAEQCAEQLLELIEEVLEITKINAGQFPNEEQVFEFKLLIDSIVKLMAPAAKQKNLSLIVDYDPALPKFVIGRYHPIHRILMNLLSNAIKFTHEGQITISIRLLEKNDQQIKIVLSVQDTGIGIAEHHHQRIFEQFERLNAAYDGNYQGRGLGLYIVKQFADLLGSTVNVQSAEGEGTTMELEFLLTIANNPSPKDISPIMSTVKTPVLKKRIVESHIVNTGSVLANNQLKVLLVEDSPIAARVANIALANLVSEIDVAETGQKAIELATQRQYDLIFLDIGLPDISGLEVSKAIRQFENENNRNAIPIIALTAHLDSLNTALSVGIQQIIYKPMTAEKAEIILKNWAQSPRSQQSEEPVKPQTQAIDLSIAEKLVGNRALAQSMLDDFIKTLPNDVQKIKNAFNSKDRAVLKDAVHYLNGGSSYAGVPLLKKACNSLEMAITDDFSDTEITELFEDICNEANKVLESYSAILH